MTVPTVTGTGTPNSGTTGSVTYTLPTHQAGDILLLFVECGQTTGVPTPPSGWAHVPNSPRAQGSNVTAGNLMWLRAASSSETNPVVPAQANHQVGFTAGVRGCISSGNPYDTGGQGVGSNLNTAFTVTGTSTTVNDCLVVVLASSATSSASDQFGAFTDASLSSITKQTFFGTVSGNGGSVDMITGSKATAGATGTITATQASSSQWVGIMIALLADTGTTPVSLTGAVSDLALAAPAGSFALTVAITGAVAAMTLGAPAGTCTTTSNVALTGAVANIAFAAPAGTVATTSNVTLTGAVAPLALAAPNGTVATQTNVALTGAVANLALGAPAGTVATGGSVSLTGAVAPVVFAAPAGTVVTQTNIALTGAVAHLALAAPAGTVATVSSIALTGATASLVLAAPAGTVTTPSVVLVPGTSVNASVILRTQPAEVVPRDIPADVVTRTQPADVVSRVVAASVITRKVGADVTVSQDYSSTKTWTSDWTLELAQPKLVGVTITGTPTVTCTDVRVTAASPTITDAGKSVTFKASQTGITVPTTVQIVVGVTLSNGDTDQRNFGIQFTDT